MWKSGQNANLGEVKQRLTKGRPLLTSAKNQNATIAASSTCGAVRQRGV
jgi:hypothetical protein